jgi:hypothetical protein
VKELQIQLEEANRDANENDAVDLNRVADFLTDHLTNYIKNEVEDPLVNLTPFNPLAVIHLTFQPEGEMSKTADDYQTLMIETQARIDAALVTNPGVVERYQQREEQVNGIVCSKDTH